LTAYRLRMATTLDDGGKALVQDFLPWLRDAVERLRASGQPDAAEELDSAARCAYTTSTEMLGEIGTAIVRVQRKLGPALPDEAAEQLRRCLVEIRKVWPGIY
jgi:hypothetical protein